MRLLSHPDSQDFSLATVLYALGDPVRLQVVKQLAGQGEVACGGFDLRVAKSTMSHHFRILRESGIIRCRRSGTQHLNSLRKTELDDRFPGLLDSILAAIDASTSVSQP